MILDEMEKASRITSGQNDREDSVSNKKKWGSLVGLGVMV